MFITSHDFAEYRQKRLVKAARLAAAILGLTQDQLKHLVYHINDHKGELTVVWNHDHTPMAEMAWTVAWEQCGEYNVTHQWAGDQDALEPI